MVNYYVIPGLIKCGLNHIAVMNETCKVMGISKADILKKTRRWEIVDARHICFFIMSCYMKISLIKIAGLFDCDHTTVIHGREKIRKLLTVDKPIISAVTKIKENLGIIYA